MTDERKLTVKYVFFLSTQLAFIITMCLIVITCFFAPDHRITVCTDGIGEWFIEGIMAVIMIPTATYFFCYELTHRKLG